jgi:signal peptidase I
VQRGDIIVFKYPVDPSVNYIKRVIGLPGDVIEVIDKRVYVNGALLEVPEEIPATELKADLDNKFKEFNLHVYKTSTGKHQHLFIESEDIYDPRTAQKARMQIPDGQYFVMGDNRDFSQDSRVWGLVPFENIKGRAIAVWFSLALPSADTEFRFRWRRIGTVLH